MPKIQFLMHRESISLTGDPAAFALLRLNSCETDQAEMHIDVVEGVSFTNICRLSPRIERLDATLMECDHPSHFVHVVQLGRLEETTTEYLLEFALPPRPIDGRYTIARIGIVDGYEYDELVSTALTISYGEKGAVRPELAQWIRD